MATGIYTQADYAIQHTARAAYRARVVYGFGRLGVLSVAVGAYAFLWLPILLLVLFSFNDSRSITTWMGFSLKWYETIFSGAVGTGSNSFSSQMMLNALQNSLFVAGIATVLSTAIGTSVAIALSRAKFQGKKWVNALLFFPMIIPDITQAMSLALFFKVVFDFIEMISGQRVVNSFSTIVIGHVAFNISYVAIVVMARMRDMNPRVEEAAADLGANAWQTFRYITFPLIFPGVLAAALLALTMSLDDFIVSFFLSGVGTSTLPIYVHSMIKVSITPEINAISALMLAASTLLIIVSLTLQGGRRAR